MTLRVWGFVGFGRVGLLSRGLGVVFCGGASDPGYYTHGIPLAY